MPSELPATVRAAYRGGGGYTNWKTQSGIATAMAARYLIAGVRFMRSFLVVGACLFLAGCVTNERGEIPGRSEFYRTADTAKTSGLLTPAIVEECSRHVLQYHSNARGVKIVGPFEISTSAAIRGAEYKLTLLPDHSADNTVAVVAPVNLETPLGEWKAMSGCLYRLHDNRLVFETAKTFGRRIDVRRTNSNPAPRQQE